MRTRRRGGRRWDSLGRMSERTFCSLDMEVFRIILGAVWAIIFTVEYHAMADHAGSTQ
jgi:hypothetical protein